MKKSYFFAALAVAGLLSSCSSDDAITTGENGASDGLNGLVEIQLGVSNNVVTGARGTGTVGGVVDAEGNPVDGEGVNEWCGQAVNVYMLNKGTLGIAEFKSEIETSVIGGPIFDNAVLLTPTSTASGVATREDASVKYYPSKGNFDFWGYRLDQDEVQEPVFDVINDVETDSAIYVPFVIDGSQDVMVAKPSYTSEELAAAGVAEERVFSAFSARNNIQPNLLFKHLLTRLRFTVKGGNETAANDIKVVGISIVSNATGKLVAALNKSAIDNGAEQQIVWDETVAPDTLALKKRAEGDDASKPLIPLLAEGTDLSTSEAVEAAWDQFAALGWDAESGEGVKTGIGEALLVSPSEDGTYKMIITLSQKVVTKRTVETNEEGEDVTVEEVNYELFPVEFTLSNGTPAQPFLAGHSYKINATVYGLQEIVIKTTLEPWADGGEIGVTPEDEMTPAE